MALRKTVRLHQHRGHRITAQPAAEPATSAEMLTHMRLTDTGGTDLDDLVTEAREWIERKLNLAMIDQTWLLTLDAWPGGYEEHWDGVRDGHRSEIFSGVVDVEIPRWPLSSITTINVYDEAGNATAVTVADVFDVDTNSLPGRITRKANASWPVALRSSNAIEITYVAGYGSAATDVPATLKRAVMNLAAALYSTRGDGCSDSELIEKSGIGGILDDYRVRRI